MIVSVYHFSDLGSSSNKLSTDSRLQATASEAERLNPFRGAHGRALCGSQRRASATRPQPEDGIGSRVLRFRAQGFRLSRV